MPLVALLQIMDPTQSFFNFASDLSKQLITVSTGIVGLSITFLKDVHKKAPGANDWALKWSWLSYLTSVIFGFWTLMALTGALTRMVDRSSSVVEIDIRLQLPASLQIIAFIIATILLVKYGISALKSLGSSPIPASTRSSE
jgi:hypothetical protein